MNSIKDRLASLSPAQRALLDSRLRQRASAETRSSDLIAVVGMACRFPGATNPTEFWDLIAKGGCRFAEIPTDRWHLEDHFDPEPETPGKMSVRWGAFLDQVDRFDPVFFGITPREAARMDPQQRLLLEVAWEAMEDAGLVPEHLSGSKTGVFVGVGQTDYSKIPVQYETPLEYIDAHSGTGNALSIAANRISYIFNFQGPSMSVDTACSSALVAIHLAMQSLRSGECDVALAGAVNLIMTPDAMIALSKARMLSTDGRCRPFDQAANGYVRGEGCGTLVLKRLSDARDDGDQVLAILRHSAVNHVGRTSGITAPNGGAQKSVIRAALSGAGLSPSDISYIEAHGTGTPLGDPIEVQALGEVFRGDGDAEPCYLTSVKGNIGHTEIAAGLAGLIKVILMMKHGQIPGQPLLDQINPHIHLEGTRLRIPRQSIAWDTGSGPRIAGVSSFGFGGTNAHVIVEAPAVLPPAFISNGSLPAANSGTASPAPEAPPSLPERPLHVLPVTAKTKSGLAQRARQFSRVLRESETEFADMCHTAGVKRSHFGHRAAIVAATSAAAADALDKLADGETAAGITVGLGPVLNQPAVGFLFTGQGSQYPGMGRQLFEREPRFRETMERCEAVFAELTGQSLLGAIYGAAGDPSVLDETGFTQPALFALEYAVASLWRSWGIEPMVLLGHSVGEYAAACLAEVFSLPDAMRLITARGQLMQQLPRDGSMAVIFAGQQHVEDALASVAHLVSVAAVNGPDNTVISGDTHTVQTLVERFERAGVGTQRLAVSHAFHSALMTPMLDAFDEVAQSIEYAAPKLPLISNLTGKLLRDPPGADYWRQHIIAPVLFAQGMEQLLEQQPDILLEVGPAPVLLGMGRRCLPKAEIAWLPSLRKGQDEWKVLMGSLAELYCRGSAVDWAAVDRPWPRDRVDLPSYPFERSRHWLEGKPASNGDARGPRGPMVHPLLGGRIPSALETELFEVSLRPHSPAYLADHQVQGSIVVPGAVYLEQGLAACDQMFGPGLHGLEDVSIQRPLFLPDKGLKLTQVSLAPEAGGRSRFQVHSASPAEGGATPQWALHATGTLCHAETLTSETPLAIDLDTIKARTPDVKTQEEFYKLVADRELVYGPSFQRLASQHRNRVEALMELNAPLAKDADRPEYRLHPTLGDACAQAMAGIVPLEPDGSYSPHTYIPVAIGRLRRFSDLADAAYVYALRTSDDTPSPEVVEGNLYLTDAQGVVMLEMTGFRVQRLSRSASDQGQKNVRDWLYGVQWQPIDDTEIVPTTTDAPVTDTSTCLIFADQTGVGHLVAEQLRQAGRAVAMVLPGDHFAMPADVHDPTDTARRAYRVDPTNSDDLARLLRTVAAEQKNGGQAGLGDLIYLWSLDAVLPADSNGQDELADARRLSWLGGLRLIQQAARLVTTRSPRLSLVTCGAQAVVGGEPLQVAQAPLWGLGRVAALEHAELQSRLIDVDPTTTPPQQASELLAELRRSDGETQVAYRGGQRYRGRLVRTPEAIAEPDQTGDGPLVIPAQGAYRLRISNAGSLEGLRVENFSRAKPAPGQVELEVRAAGLNFSDVLKLLGLYPGITDPIVPLGIECSGVVTAVGPGVERFHVGDRVMGVAPFSFASHAITAEYALVPRPDSLDDCEASTVPITFLTAHYALHWLARLEPGERVLIHAAAGGVGLAAIQIAQHIGAEIFATAGSEAKRDFVRSLGVKHVMSSRDLRFADEIMRLTDRQGVDVVLNSLPGEAIPKSISILSAYGRFLEIGKIDIYQNRMIGLSPFQDNLSYFAIDLDRMLRQRPEQIRRLFAEVMGLFEAGHYRPMSFTEFPMAEAVDAFRYMAQRKNIGKVVLSLETPLSASASDSTETELIRADGTYLITGGSGALGLQVAAWLADAGAEHVVLLARRPFAGEAFAAAEALRARGVAVREAIGDVTDAASLRAALASIPAEYPPLRGVFHAAGALDDGVLFDMDEQRLDNAMRPKVQGAWNLHRATLDAPLDHFVLFSSIATIFGSPGQGNYAAGNAFLDGLAHFRRNQGLPALSINWGPWATAGMATQGNLGESIEAQGLSLLPPTQCLAVMKGLMQKVVAGQGQPQTAVMDVDWQQLFRRRSGAVPSLMSDLAPTAEAKDDAVPDDPVAAAFREQLRSADPPKRETMLVTFFAEKLAKIMGLEIADLDVVRPLNTMGLDSLMAIELRNMMETQLRVALPMARFMEGPSVTSLAGFVSESMGGATAEQHAVQIQHVTNESGQYPLSYGQRALWFIQQLAPQSSAYNIHIPLRMRGPLDVAAFEASLRALIERHPILRTVYPFLGGRPVQQVLSQWELPLRKHDADDWDEARLSAEMRTEIRRPFDLKADLPLRVALYHRGPDDWAVLYVIHHIATDFWSLVAAVSEFKVLYESTRKGEPISLQPPSLEYSDFARWQSEMLVGVEGNRHWEYWQTELAGELPVLNLPTDRPRPPVKTFNGSHLVRQLDSELTDQVRRLCQETGATLHTVLLAAFQVLLHRYTGQEDILIGTPTSGRTRSEFADMLGYFVNPVVIRGDLSGNPSFVDFLAHTQRRMHAALDHQDYPLPLLVERLHVERDPSRSPLFDVLFVTQRTQSGQDDQTKAMFAGALDATASLDQVQANGIELDVTTAMFDLILTATEYSQQIGLTLRYDTDLFDAVTAEQILQNFATLLTGLVSQASCPVSNLPLLPANQRTNVILSGRIADNVHHDLVQLIRQQVERSPDAIALACGDQHLSYDAMNRQSDRLARLLRLNGVATGSRVGICLRRGIDLVIALQATLKAGGTYVPLDPDYPQQRLENIIEGAAIDVVISSEANRGCLDSWSGTLLSLDNAEQAEAIAAQDDGGFFQARSADDLTYAIFTSGSTGQPKGASVYDRGFANLVQWYIRELEITDQDRSLVITSPGFDLTQKNFFAPLCVGGQVRLSASSLFDPENLTLEIEQGQVTLLNCTPSHFYALVSLPDAPHRLASLRAVILGGEQIDLSRLEGWWRAGDFRCSIINSYGPTECSDVVAFHRLDPAHDLERTVPIGKPIDGCRLSVVDKNLQPLPAGVPGELCIGGTCVGAGYLNDPELTAEKFVRSLGDSDEQPWYRTGDLCRQRSDGTVEFIGRIDHQVKIRGFRIELGEIEAALRRNPTVHEAIVLVSGDHAKLGKLVAYVTLHDGRNFDREKLISHLREFLPDYMIPNAWVPLESMPLSPHGKIDRSRLPCPQDETNNQIGHLSPRTTMEQRLATIWSQLLGVDPVGVRDDFFELGGHSLVAVELVNRIADEFGCRLPLAELIRGRTIEALALLIESTGQADWSPLVALRTTGTLPPLFLVHPAGGNVLCYQPLAASLGDSQPVYAIQARGVEEGQQPHSDLHEMLQDYAAAINSVYPEGPVFLAGWSLGGVLAYQLAGTLKAQQREVALVALLDSYHPSLLDVEVDDEAMILAEFVDSCRQLIADLPEFDRTALVAMSPPERLQHVANYFSTNAAMPLAIDLNMLKNFLAVAKANLKAALVAPSAINQQTDVGRPIEVHLFRPTECGANPMSKISDRGWGSLEEDHLVTHDVGGNHWTMLSGMNAVTLTAVLRDAISNSLHGVRCQTEISSV